MTPSVQPAPLSAQVLPARQSARDSVTPSLSAYGFECANCQGLFTPKSTENLYCSGKCRQAAYRRSPAHKAVLAGLRAQRANRRLSWHRRRNAAKSICFDGLYSGPTATGVPSLGEIDLRQFSKERGRA
jgi:hypothetical protein